MTYKQKGRSGLEKQREKTSMLGSAAIGNIGHILIAFIASILITLLKGYNVLQSVALVLVFIAILFFWFCIGARVTKQNKDNFYHTGVITAILSILPAVFFTIVSQILSVTTQGAEALTRWNTFYVFGGPTLFWHRPFSFIHQVIAGNGFTINAYTIYYISFLLIAGVIFLGAIFFGRSRQS